MLPQMIQSNTFISTANKKLLILAEGFEARSLSWINNEENKLIFNRALLCRYSSHEKNRLEDVLDATKRHCSD